MTRQWHSILRIARTARHLRPVQLYGRAWFRVYRPRVNTGAPPPRRDVPGRWQRGARRAACMVAPDTFRMLNETHAVEHARDWNRSDWSRLWLYHLHYFDDLAASDAAHRREWHAALLQRWIKENPPARGTGWEPYPISRRSVNWIKYALGGGELDGAVCASLAVQLRYLRRRLEYHLLANHLLANAKALVFGGLFFGGDEGERWLNDGLRILREQVQEQILGDGGHFERSPMYHSVVLEDLLDLYNLARAAGTTHLEPYEPKIEKMITWLTAMTRPDGSLAVFNDTSGGMAPAPEDLFEYAVRLGFSAPTPSRAQTWLRESGYLRWTVRDKTLFAAIGSVAPDYQPGHAHADTLSCELCMGNQPIFTNTGVSHYAPDDARRRQRATESHNAVCVDSESSSETWHGHRVARRARIVEVAVEPESVMAAHDGFKRLPGLRLHRRRWRLHDSGLEVSDEVTGRGRRQVEVYWHMHPGLTARKTSDRTFALSRDDGSVLATLSLEGADTLEVVPGNCHAEFGLAQPRDVIVARHFGSLPVVLKSSVRWTGRSTR